MQSYQLNWSRLRSQTAGAFGAQNTYDQIQSKGLNYISFRSENSLLMHYLKDAKPSVDLDIVQSLIALGNRANHQNKVGLTPLMCAAQNNKTQLSIFDALLSAGAKALIKDQNGKTALQIYRGSDQAVVQMLKKAEGQELIDDLPSQFSRYKSIILQENLPRFRQIVKEENLLHKIDEDGNNYLTLLLKAFPDEKFSLQAAKFLIELGLDINVCNKLGDSPLMLAAKGYQVDPAIFDLLIKNKANVNATNLEGDSPLMLAAKRSLADPDIFDLLINNKANVNATNLKGENALMLLLPSLSSSYCGQNEKNVLLIIEALVNSGTEIKKQDNQGHTALCYGINYNCNSSIFELLVKDGPPVKLNEKTKSYLFSSDLQRIKLILYNNYDASQVDEDNNNLLMLLIDKNFSQYGYGHDKFKVEDLEQLALKLLQLNTDVNQVNKKKQTALMLLSKSKLPDRQYLNLLRSFIQKGVDINYTDQDGNNSMLLRIQSTIDLEILQEFVKAGLDVNQLNKSGDFPLKLAAKWQPAKKIEVTNLLLSYGANVNQIDKSGENALFYMIRHFTEADRQQSVQETILKLLSLKINPNQVNRYGQNVLFELLASANSNEYVPIIVQDLIKCGIDVNSVDRQGRSVLHTIGGQLVPTIKYLIAAGANVNHEDQQGNSVLLTAIQNLAHSFITSSYSGEEKTKGAESIEILLKEVKFTYRDKNNSILKLFKARNIQDQLKSKVLDLLIKHGANVNHIKDQDQTALLTDDGIKLPNMKLLIAANADVSFVNNQGVSAILKVCQSVNLNSCQIELLLRHGANVNSVDNKGQHVFSLIRKRSRLNQECSKEISKCLLRGGFDLKLLNEDEIRMIGKETIEESLNEHKMLMLQFMHHRKEIKMSEKPRTLGKLPTVVYRELFKYAKYPEFDNNDFVIQPEQQSYNYRNYSPDSDDDYGYDY